MRYYFSKRVYGDLEIYMKSTYARSVVVTLMETPLVSRTVNNIYIWPRKERKMTNTTQPPNNNGEK